MTLRRGHPLTAALVLMVLATLAACGPTATPSPGATASGLAPTDSPTNLPSGQPPQATAPPTIAPAGSPSEQPPETFPPFSPDATAALLAHIPEALRGSCVPGEPLAPVIVVVTCTGAGGAVTVEYAQYPDRASMLAAYNERVRVVQIETDSGLCFEADSGGAISATPNRWPSEHEYSVADSPVGRYLCTRPNEPTIAWTHDNLAILGVTSAAEESIDQLVRFWVNDSGPLP